MNIVCINIIINKDNEPKNTQDNKNNNDNCTYQSGSYCLHQNNLLQYVKVHS